MGLLDDAIREHLDLKRRSGADPNEIERLEREALGPVRRRGYDDDEIPPAGDPGPEFSQPEDRPTELWSEVSDEPGFADHGAEFLREAEAWRESDVAETGFEPDVAPPVRPTPPPPEEAPPGQAPVDEDELVEQETVEHELDAESPEDSGREYPGSRQPGHPAPPDSGSSEPEERGHPAAPEEDRGGDPEREDMLEETPEFLQDTPDHDRLWFEQRPPRDFDLDG